MEGPHEVASVPTVIMLVELWAVTCKWAGINGILSDSYIDEVGYELN